MALSVRRLKADEAALLRTLRVHPDAQSVFPVDFSGEGEEWGLWLDERLIGWCRLAGQPPVLWVSRILIDAPYVGLGYGKVLWEQILEEKGRLKAWREVRAAVHPANGRALRFFERLGFEALPYAEQVGEVILRKVLI